MKKTNWILAVLVLACLGVFFGYRTLTDRQTDSRPPEILMEEAVDEVSVTDPEAMLLQGVTARDDRDGDVTASLVVERISLVDRDGTVDVSIAAFDRSGNVAKATRRMKYKDYESPRLVLSGPLYYPYGSSFDVLGTVGARDLLDGDIQHRVRATVLYEDSISGMGTHTVQFRVSNSLGDTVKLDLPVVVYDRKDYLTSLQLTEYLVYLDKGDSFRPEDYLSSFTLQGKSVSLSGGLPEKFTLETLGGVNTGIPGVYHVEYEVDYFDNVYGLAASAGSVLIVVVEG